MVKKTTKESLADRIAGVLSAVPAQFDPEDENTDNTNAKLVKFDDIDDENDNDDTLLSKFRKQNIDLLADVDTRYAGKKKSRRSLREDEESSDEFTEEVNGEESEDGSNSVDDNDATNDDHGDDESEEQSELDEEDISDHSEIEDSHISNEENESNFRHMSDTNLSEQVKKGHCVRNQMTIWENLLEMRIQMQKCLVAANKMPQKAHFKEMQKQDDSDGFQSKVNETKDSLSNVLDKFLRLQTLVIKRHPETKNLEKINKRKTQAINESDEEIPSDTDDDPQDTEDESGEEIGLKEIKRKKLNDYEAEISELHEKYKHYRNDTIEKWNTKTRLSVMKNLGQTHSFINQIEHILGDKDKLRKKTQLKRSEYKILGQDDDGVAMEESNEDKGDVKPVEEYNTEIFDDSDFYHQLLRELIEVKSADITDPVQLGRQWIQLQNLRSKMKRKIDTRATKGRKIRYAVHTKLVNFMAPMDKQRWTEEAKNELYSSLFGKSIPKRA